MPNELPTPQNNEQRLLNIIANNTAGEGDGAELPVPQNNTQRFLKEIAESTAGGGGGGGSSLPAVTSDDNGDVLTVVEGQWAKAAPSGGGDTLILTLNEETGLYDHTFNEVRTALLAGKRVIEIWDGEDGIECTCTEMWYTSKNGDDYCVYDLGKTPAHDNPFAKADSPNGYLTLY